MDFLKKLISEHSAGLVSGLVSKTGFSADQAQAFVPEAADRVADVVKGGDIDFADLGAASRTVIDKVDVNALAGKVGIDTAQAQKGLGALVPMLLQLVQEKAGGAAGIMSLLGGEGGIGKMVGGLGKMFGK